MSAAAPAAGAPDGPAPAEDWEILDAATAALARAAHPFTDAAHATGPSGGVPAGDPALTASAPASAPAPAFAAPPLQDAVAFVHRLAVRQRFSPPCAVLALCYLERVAHALPLAATSARRLILTALLVAAKFHDDHTFTNRDWAASDAISLQDLNRLELLFLKALDWRAALSQADYLDARARLLAEHKAASPAPSRRARPASPPSPGAALARARQAPALAPAQAPAPQSPAPSPRGSPARLPAATRAAHADTKCFRRAPCARGAS